MILRLTTCLLCVALAHGKPAPETLRQLNLFSEVFRYIKSKSVRPMSDEALITHAIQGMLSGVDGHSTYITTEKYQDLLGNLSGRFAGIGIEFTEKHGQPTIIAPLDDSPALKAGIQGGDILMAADGVSFFGLSLDSIRKHLKGDAGTKLTLTIKRGHQEKKLQIKRQFLHLKGLKHTVKDGVLIIRLSHFNEGISQRLKSVLQSQDGKNAKIICLDLTNNPGGIFEEALDIVNLFLNHGVITTVDTRYKANNKTYHAHKKKALNTKTPLYIFVNQGTASSAEIVTAALMDHGRARVLGQKTFGKGSVQTILPIPPGYTAVQLTTGLYKTPKGQLLDGKGVHPHRKIDTSNPQGIHWMQRMVDAAKSYS